MGSGKREFKLPPSILTVGEKSGVSKSEFVEMETLHTQWGKVWGCFSYRPISFWLRSIKVFLIMVVNLLLVTQNLLWAGNGVAMSHQHTKVTFLENILWGGILVFAQSLHD